MKPWQEWTRNVALIGTTVFLDHKYSALLLYVQRAGGCISNVSASLDSSEMQARLPSPKIMPHSEVLRYIL